MLKTRIELLKKYLTPANIIITLLIIGLIIFFVVREYKINQRILKIKIGIQLAYDIEKENLENSYKIMEGVCIARYANIHACLSEIMDYKNTQMEQMKKKYQIDKLNSWNTGQWRQFLKEVDYDIKQKTNLIKNWAETPLAEYGMTPNDALKLFNTLKNDKNIVDQASLSRRLVEMGYSKISGYFIYNDGDILILGVGTFDDLNIILNELAKDNLSIKTITGLMENSLIGIDENDPNLDENTRHRLWRRKMGFDGYKL